MLSHPIHFSALMATPYLSRASDQQTPPQVAALHVFQRTPNWFFPKMDPVYPGWLKVCSFSSTSPFIHSTSSMSSHRPCSGVHLS